jgi:hypothetical protein
MYTRQQDKIDENLVTKLLSLSKALERSVSDVFYINAGQNELDADILPNKPDYVRKRFGSEFIRFDYLVDGREIVKTRINRCKGDVIKTFVNHLLISSYLHKLRSNFCYGSRIDIGNNLVQVLDLLYNQAEILNSHSKSQGEYAFLFSPSDDDQTIDSQTISYSNDEQRTKRESKVITPNFNRRRLDIFSGQEIHFTFNSYGILSGFLDEIESLKHEAISFMGLERQLNVSDDLEKFITLFENQRTYPLFASSRNSSYSDEGQKQIFASRIDFPASDDLNVSFTLSPSYSQEIGKFQSILSSVFGIDISIKEKPDVLNIERLTI